MKEDAREILRIVTSSTIENTLNTITSLGAVSVSRKDHSPFFDKTGKETEFLKLIYRISFIGIDDTDDPPSLSVEGNLNTISANIVTENNLSKKDLVIRLTTSRPSGSKNVMVYVVLHTELGLVWDAPIYNGGLNVLNYLVEWDELYHIDRGKVSPTKPYSDGDNGPLVHS